MSERSVKRKSSRPSKAELLAEPLARARDLLRVLEDACPDSQAAKIKPVDAALRACERLLRALAGVETNAGRRAFTREFYRAWATILEVREILVDPQMLRVFDEIEEALESARRMLRRFDELGSDAKGYRA